MRRWLVPRSARAHLGGSTARVDLVKDGSLSVREAGQRGLLAPGRGRSQQGVAARHSSIQDIVSRSTAEVSAQASKPRRPRFTQRRSISNIPSCARPIPVHLATSGARRSVRNEPNAAVLFGPFPAVGHRKLQRGADLSYGCRPTCVLRSRRTGGRAGAGPCRAYRPGCWIRIHV